MLDIEFKEYLQTGFGQFFICSKMYFYRVVPTRVLGLSQSIGIDCIQGKEFRQSFIGAPMLASGGGKNKKQVALLTCQGGGTLIPYTG